MCSMKSKLQILVSCLGCCLILPVGIAAIQADDAPPTIKSIMKVAFKDGLARKVATGGASDAEKAELLKLSQSLAKLQPPQGEADSWKEKTTALIAAAQAAVKGDPEAPALLRTSTNCMACHAVHKPE